MNNKYKILLVEDDASISDIVTTLFEANGYQVIGAASYLEGRTMYNSYRPDLVLLDLGLPDRDGGELISDIRESSTTPIIVLSARCDEEEKVRMLDLGANDYVTKPFGSSELVARVRSALRSHRYSLSADAPNSEFTLGELVIYYDKRRVKLRGEDIHLTQTEYNILANLSKHCGKVLTYSAIIKAIWGDYPDDGAIKRLQVNMANIRRKFGVKPGEYSYIYNELGVGYRLDE